jgi:hypothetical protein
MRKALALSLFAALTLLMGAAPRARAAVIMALDLPALIQQSDHVVVAKAEASSARYVDGLIVTDVSLRVISALKGPAEPGATLIATHLGGAVGQVELSVPGAAHFVIGQSAIVFLRRAAGSSELNVTGMTQGIMPIAGSGSSAHVMVGGGSGATLMQRDTNGAIVEAPKPGPQQQTLAKLLADIQHLVAAGN